MYVKLRIDRTDPAWLKRYEATFQSLHKSWIIEDLEIKKQALKDLPWSKFGEICDSRLENPKPERSNWRYHWSTLHMDMGVDVCDTEITVTCNGRHGGLLGYDGAERSEFITPVAEMLLDIMFWVTKYQNTFLVVEDYESSDCTQVEQGTSLKTHAPFV